MSLPPITLHEPSRRRSDWQAGEWIDFGVLGRWSFPRPKVVTGTLTTPRGAFLTPSYVINGCPAPEMDELVDEVTSTSNSLAAGMALCGFVLSHNYTINADEFEALVIGGVASASGDKSALSRKMMTVCYGESVEAAARLIASFPKFRADRSGVVVGGN